MKDKQSGAEATRGKSKQQGPAATGSPEWSAWLRSVDAARKAWNRLSYNDLAQTGGDPQKLVTLLKRHYDLTERDARLQVKEFLDQGVTARKPKPSPSHN